MRTAGIATALMLGVALAFAMREVTAQAPGTFEVASIRRNTTPDQQGSGLAGPQPGGRFIARGATLRRLISDAYDGLEVEGGPPWTGSDRFDVNASGSAVAPLDIRRMLRSLLAERFALTVHIETR